MITLLTDFGDADAFVGIMKGVILSIAPSTQIVDLSHQVPAQQLIPAALLLRSAVPFFPKDTIHLVVVDPGVGSARKAIVIETAAGILIGPDNGVLMPAAEASGIKAIHIIENRNLLRPSLSHTFHGRDVFAPVAAHLASGIAPAAVGPISESRVSLAIPRVTRADEHLEGEVIYVDHFGNLITNIGSDELATFRDRKLCVSIGAVKIEELSNAYSEVAEGQSLAVINSWEMLEIAVRNGNAAIELGVDRGARVRITGFE